MTKRLPSNYYVVVDGTSGNVMLHKPLKCDPDRWDVFDLHVKGENMRSIHIVSHKGNVAQFFPMVYDHVLNNGMYHMESIPVGAVLCWWGDNYSPIYDRKHKDFNWNLYQKTIDKILERYGQKE
ncbi:MAG: hypothetical protein LUD47_05220 [Clostridia bacterium]|nr:hypothetical protein [Clostridia bacterium]